MKEPQTQKPTSSKKSQARIDSKIYTSDQKSSQISQIMEEMAKIQTYLRKRGVEGLFSAIFDALPFYDRMLLYMEVVKQY